MFWHIGNTTIRNPFRIKDLAQTFYNHRDDLKDLYKTGPEAEIEQAKLFEIAKEANVIDTDTEILEKKAWHGRKLRLTLYEMGIITDGSLDDSHICTLTKTGMMLINSEIEHQQYIWSRIIFSLETRKKGYDRKISKPLKPAPLVLSILLALEKANYKSILSIHELALIVMTGKPEKAIREYINDIFEFRKEIKINQGNLRELYDKKYKAIARENNIKVNTINDYKDVTRRYLLISGIFLEKGNGLTINPNYKKQSKSLSNEIDSMEWREKENYFKRLTDFPKLSINENKELLIDLVKSNQEFIKDSGASISEPKYEGSIEDLEVFRVTQENLIRHINEKEYAHNQRYKTDVILKWINYLEIGKSPNEEFDDEYISYRKSDERPKLLEWIIWRAFLSINSLQNEPFESRNFKIDNNFKPINHAPGGGADLVFEFEKFILVVELTWLTTSRQISNEVMPVANHVAEVAFNTEKKVFGLLIAPKIEPNTLQQYKNMGAVILNFEGNEIEQNIELIPITIGQFKNFFEKIPKASPNNPDKILSILNNCRDKDIIQRSYSEWREHISNQFA